MRKKEEKKRISFSVDKRVYDYVVSRAQKENRSFSSYINHIIMNLIKSTGDRESKNFLNKINKSPKVQENSDE